MPETDLDYLARLKAGVRHVIFNQNSHLTWKRAAAEAKDLYQASKDLAAVITVSDHNKEMLNCAFPNAVVHRVHLGVDPDLFSPGDQMSGRRIGYMPRRGSSDAKQVIEILRARGMLEGWELVPMEGMTHSEVAEQLKSTMIFLAFTHQEGFGLPAAEAMACGNYVIGNHGFGGKEFFLPEFSAPIENGDVLGFVRAVEAALSNNRAQPGWCRDRGLAASRFIRSEYSMARERREVVKTYNEILTQTQSGEIVPSGEVRPPSAAPSDNSSLRLPSLLVV
ncbi:MAG TPA: glycosyltransferase [Rhizobiaceae bacterium]|nr:glycosyltransferase [Rhizobiaceae bacterium]